ncbi:AraC family transcriptional regulator [Paracoccus sp. (in: a-proteobacteria)]|uniref:AraC family transcriptional regulator n=1 Tax=Paracoccus sp. TaxID=267 RepID=UPI003A89F65D
MTAEQTPPVREYFADHPVLRTHDLDEARHRVAQQLCDHRLEIRHRSAPLSVRHNAVRGCNISVNYLSYGPEVSVDPGSQRPFYLLHLALSGKTAIQHRGEEMTASPALAAILNPDRGARLHWGESCRKLLFQIDRAHVEAVAVALTGAPLPGPIRFDMKVDLGTPQGRQLQRVVTACTSAVENGNLFRRPLRGGDLRAEYDLAHALLTLQRSNITHIIERADHRARPRAIRQAMNYIHANLSEPITLADIAAAADINVRTLQMGFQRDCGLSPMQVLRNARLDTARYRLMARQDAPSVSEAAYSAGFSHLGRFSRDYKDRFGHSPSENPVLPR